jgi:hypothetical protein
MDEIINPSVKVSLVPIVFKKIAEEGQAVL